MNDVVTFVRDLVLQLWAYDGIKTIVLHVLLNLTVAVSASIKDDSFDLGKLAEFLYKKLLPYALVYGVAKIAAPELGLSGLEYAVWAIIESTLAGDLVENLDRLGVPLPEPLVKMSGGKAE